MIPLLLAALGGALVVHHYHTKKASPTAALKVALGQPASAPGQMTPARAAVHGELMAHCHDPGKLQRAAALFGHEGLPEHAQALLRKAAMVHEMMHGAKAIVERCRAGDQHAMAMAKSIGEQARAGNKRAQISAFLIERYTQQHPPQNGNGAQEAPPQAAA